MQCTSALRKRRAKQASSQKAGSLPPSVQLPAVDTIAQLLVLVLTYTSFW
jgi:hypothetical protein